MLCKILFRLELASVLSDSEDHETGEIIPGCWRNDPPPTSCCDFSPTCSNNLSNGAKLIREVHKEFFNNEGAVSWQWQMCGIDLEPSLPQVLPHIFGFIIEISRKKYDKWLPLWAIPSFVMLCDKNAANISGALG